ncbi:MAG: bis(5'-nucleosyl)-tetraphosphatase (symmetrical) YqeK [Clostridia bacterium]|nr:bis(5'-nucleosyl)-tetraphosphatase (symmetrical) YqeK [Clostridia bacterium]
MGIEEIKKKLETILTPKRYLHSINVMQVSESLAKKHGEDSAKAALAGLLHDCARDITDDELIKQCERYNVKLDDICRFQPELLHAMLGAELARHTYGIHDQEILKSIRFHTTGCRNMSLLNKIVFIADSIEPGRIFPGVEEIRSLACEDINAAVELSLERTIKHVLNKGTLIHPDTIDARNHLILERKINAGKL